MPRKGYLPEFRRRAVELLRSGRSFAEVVRLLEVSDASLYLWRRQDRIDRREITGVFSTEHAELHLHYVALHESWERGVEKLAKALNQVPR